MTDETKQTEATKTVDRARSLDQTKSADGRETERQLAIVESRVDELEAELSHVRSQLIELEQRKAAADTEAQELAAEVKSLRAALADIKSSASWRWTQPFRWLKHRLL